MKNLILTIIFSVFLIIQIITAVDTNEGTPNIAIGSTKEDMDKDTLFDKVYYFIRADIRDCEKPHCGGYFIKRLNSIEGMEESNEIYVSEMMVTDKSLNVAMIEDLKKSSKQDTLNGITTPITSSKVIVSGDLESSHSDGLYQCLHITDIFHVMNLPQQQPATSPKTIKVLESFYFLKSSPLKCNSMGNCPLILSLKINSKQQNEDKDNPSIQFLNSYSEMYTQAIGLLDTKWFNSRLVCDNPQYNSIIKGYMLGDKLVISSVYLNTLDPVSNCDQTVTKSHCGSQTPVFVRDINRCPMFSKCVQRGPCPLVVPGCPDGYKSISFLSGTKACLIYYCDPEFLYETNDFSILIR